MIHVRVYILAHVYFHDYVYACEVEHENVHKLTDGQVRLVRFIRLQTDNFRLFLRQQTDKRNDKLLFVQLANGKLKKENRLCFRFLFETDRYRYRYIDKYKDICIHIFVYIYIYICCRFNIYIYTRKTQITEKANFRLFSAKGKRKTEVCFPWSAKINGNRRLLFSNHAHLCVFAYIVYCMLMFRSKLAMFIFTAIYFFTRLRGRGFLYTAGHVRLRRCGRGRGRGRSAETNTDMEYGHKKIKYLNADAEEKFSLTSVLLPFTISPPHESEIDIHACQSLLLHGLVC
jgi:hypothetical protein